VRAEPGEQAAALAVAGRVALAAAGEGQRHLLVVLGQQLEERLAVAEVARVAPLDVGLDDDHAYENWELGDGGPWRWVIVLSFPTSSSVSQLFYDSPPTIGSGRQREGVTCSQ